MEQYSFKLNDFEGPLDLLLNLITQKKMKLTDINILELIDQYLKFLGSVSEAELNSATEFVEMAARLVYLKSVSLLPRNEEREKMERELSGQLIEYSICKLAARRLGDMSLGIVYFVREPMKPQKPVEYFVPHDVKTLLAAYLAVNKKSSERRSLTAEDITDVVATPIVPISTGIIHILRGMRGGKIARLEDMFVTVKTASEAVATFLGLLELIRAGRIAIANDGTVALKKKEKLKVGQ